MFITSLESSRQMEKKSYLINIYGQQSLGKKSIFFTNIYTFEIKISETDIWYEFQAVF